MGKISQGKYELFTTKEDAINKFMQMQGVCREEISGGYLIKFYCTKKGEIIISNPPTRHVENHQSTNLFAEVVQQEGKTYVTYYTEFDKSNNILTFIFIVIDLLIGVLSILFAIATKNITLSLTFLLLVMLLLGYKLFVNTKEEANSPKDSEILIKELEKRVEAVNLWDK